MTIKSIIAILISVGALFAAAPVSEATLIGQLTNETLIKGVDSIRIIQKAAQQTILARFFFYINQFIQNLISAIGLAAIR